MSCWVRVDFRQRCAGGCDGNFSGVPMAGYSYDYSLTPARETGWRSAVTTAATIVAVLAVSTISGAVVTVEQNQSKPATASVTPPVATPPGAGEAAGAAPVVTAPPATTAMATSQPTP